MEMEDVNDAKTVLTAARQVMADALNAPIGTKGHGGPVFDEECRSAAEILARRLKIDDKLGQELLDILE